MNKTNLLRIADAIEKHEIEGLGYNQAIWVSDYLPDNSGRHCGTTACLAGWAYALATQCSAKRLYEDDCRSTTSILSTAKGFLDLSSAEAQQLFRACPLDRIDNTVKDLKTHHAVRTLRYAAEHDVVDWDAANPEVVS